MSRVEFHQAHQADLADLQPGDFILTHRPGFVAWAISFGQRLRFHGKDRVFAKWEHAALVVSSQGDLVEALTAGVERSHISKYRREEYALVHVEAEPLDQSEIIGFANLTVLHHYRYGWATILCCALNALTGGKFTFGFQGQSICSGLVARALERKGEWFNCVPENITPADLARHFGVGR